MKRTLIALALLAAGAAHADATQDSLEACRQLQNGPLPIGCTVVIEEGVPVFMFGFPPNADSDEGGIAVASVVTPICSVQPVLVMFVITDGQKVLRASAAPCSAGELGQFKSLDPSTLKPTVY